MNNRWKFAVMFVTILGLVTFGAAQNAQKKGKRKQNQQNAQQDGQPKKKQQKKEQPATAPSDRVYGVRMTEDEGYHTAPAAAETADGTVHIVWIEYVENVGDTIVTRDRISTGGVRPGATRPQVLSAKPGQFIRPVLAASGNEKAWFLAGAAGKNPAGNWT